MKFRKFFRTVPMKIYLLLAAIVLFTFFSNDFGLVDIQKTAIVIAAAIDKKDEGVEVTLQIAVPKGSDRTTGGTSSVEIDAEGATVSDCVSKIYSRTGWVIKFAFCDLILLGQEAAKEDVISYLNYFLRSEYSPDNAILAVCEGTAKETISSQSAIDDASSLAIEKLFSDSAQKAGRVAVSTLNDFTIGYYGVSKSAYLPYLKLHTQEGSQNAGGGSPSGSGSSQSAGGNTEKVYSAEQTALFYEGKMVGLLTSDQTLAFNLLKGGVFASTFSANEGEKPMTLNILKNKGSVSLNMKGRPTAELKVSVLVRLCCRSTSSGIEDVSSEAIEPELTKSATQVIEGYLHSLWNVVQESGCDLFCLKRSLYRSSLKKYALWKDTLLDTVTPDFKVEVKSMK